MKVAVPLAKNILAPLRITAAVSGVQKKDTRFRDNNVNNSIKEMNDIMKIVQVLEDSNILLKGVTKAIKNEKTKKKNKKDDF